MGRRNMRTPIHVEELDRAITIAEINNSVSKLKTGKSLGYDDRINHDVEMFKEFICWLFKKVVQSELVPEVDIMGKWYPYIKVVS